ITRRPARALHEAAQRLQIVAVERGNERLADDRRVEAEQPRRGAVDRRNRSRGVHRHDAGRDALENRFDVAPTSLDFDVLSSSSIVDRWMRRRLAASSPAIALNASTSDPNSSLLCGSTRWLKWPCPISRAAAASICTGRVMRFAMYRPIHVAPTRISSVTIRK